MLTILFGILSSTAAEIITALNKKLAGTVLAGDAAFLVATGLALPAAALKEILAPGFAWHDLANVHALAQTAGEVFAVSQVYFYLVVKKLNLDIKEPAATGAAVAAAPAI